MNKQSATQQKDENKAINRISVKINLEGKVINNIPSHQSMHTNRGVIYITVDCEQVHGSKRSRSQLKPQH